MKRFLFVVLMLISASCVMADCDLKLNCQIGQTAVYTNEISIIIGDVSINGMAVPVQQTLKMNGEITKTCVAKDNAGNATVCIYSVMTSQLGTHKAYTKCLVDKRGKTLQIIEMEVDGKKTVFSKKDKQPIGTSISDFLNMSGFPNKPVKEGESWKVQTKADKAKSIEADLTSTLSKVQNVEGDSVAVINSTGTVALNLADAMALMPSQNMNLISGTQGNCVISIVDSLSELSLGKGIITGEKSTINIKSTVVDEASGMTTDINAICESITKLKELKMSENTK